jgi:hypothetical protein
LAGMYRSDFKPLVLSKYSPSPENLRLPRREQQITFFAHFS